MPKTKFVFITGGVTSSLGKGIIAASLAKLLQAQNYSVTIQKLDPYLNIDPGTLNPYEHGECFVTEDGAETDLDLGHYERFLNKNTSQANNITTGRIYNHVLKKERNGEFLGKTVQIIPHITDEIKRRIKLLAKKKFDIILTEIGGTVGDIESLPYIETIRQLKQEKKDDSIVIHLTLVPFLTASGELKTKPTQHSVKALQENGVQPDILALRTEYSLNKTVKEKVALFCNIDKDSVIEAKDASSIYEVPILMQQQGLDKVVLKKLNLSYSKSKLKEWNHFLDKLKNPKEIVEIAVIGKYVELVDSYKSIAESFIHAGTSLQVKININWIHSQDINEQNVTEKLSLVNGILVAPGFGSRDINGKIKSIKFARENHIPFFGICLGMQCAAIEFSRNVLHLEHANSQEIKPKDKDAVITLMKSQEKLKAMGATMRLGAYKCILSKDSIPEKAYKKPIIHERYRHRFEFNKKYITIFEKNGFKIVGKTPDKDLVEIIELKTHPWFIGVQFHPEYKSTVLNPHPLFISFIKAAIQNKNTSK